MLAAIYVFKKYLSKRCNIWFQPNDQKLLPIKMFYYKNIVFENVSNLTASKLQIQSTNNWPWWSNNPHNKSLFLAKLNIFHFTQYVNNLHEKVKMVGLNPKAIILLKTIKSLHGVNLKKVAILLMLIFSSLFN